MIGHNAQTGMDCESCFIWFHFRNTIPVLRKTVSYLRRERTVLTNFLKSFYSAFMFILHIGGRRGRDRMLVRSSTTYAISAYHH